MLPGGEQVLGAPGRHRLQAPAVHELLQDAPGERLVDGALTGGDLSLTTGLHIPVDAGVAAAFLR